MEKQTITLPLGTTITLREMTGHEEDLLTNEKLVRSGKALNQILAATILDIDGDSPVTEEMVLTLKSPDRLAALIELRKLSYGNMVDIKLECSNKNCNGEYWGEYDLGLLPIKEAPDKDPEKIFTATIDGKLVKVGYMDGRGEMRVSKAADTGEDIITIGMLSRIKEVEGIHPNGVSKWLKDMSVRERKKLRDLLKDTDYGYDTSIEVRCESCGRKMIGTVESQVNFFFPEK